MTDQRHPSDEQLWSADEGFVIEHLRTCARCRDRQRAVRREQDAVAGLLGSGVRERPIPPDVSARLAQALAAEAAARVPETRPDDLGARRSRSQPRWLVAATVAGLAVVGGSLLVPRLGPDGLDPPEGQAGAGEGRAEADAAAPDDGLAAASPSELPPVPADLLALGAAIVPGQQVPADGLCGAGLLTEPGTDVVGSAVVPPDVGGDPAGAGEGADAGPVATSVLVRTTGPSGSLVWWLPSCEAGPQEALGRSRAP